MFRTKSAPSLTFQVGPLRKGGLVSAQFLQGCGGRTGEGKGQTLLSPFPGLRQLGFSLEERVRKPAIFLKALGCPYPARAQDRGFPPPCLKYPWTLQGREKQSAVFKANTDLVGSSKRIDGGGKGGGVSPSWRDAHSNWFFPGQGGGGKRGQPSKREKCLLAAWGEALGTQKRWPQQLVPKVPSP